MQATTAVEDIKVTLPELLDRMTPGGRSHSDPESAASGEVDLTYMDPDFDAPIGR